MKKLFIENDIKYIGSQLVPHWIYKNFKIQGDAIVAFVGECDVKLTEMVDIEDVINNEPIYSKLMLSFITEQFNIGLVEGVLRQRLLITCIKEELERLLLAGQISAGAKTEITRNGDDIFVNGRKLSVSIATKSLTSVLIHTGVNILSDGAPIPVSALQSDLGIENIKEFAQNVMNNYCNELEDIVFASTKVRGV